MFTKVNIDRVNDDSIWITGTAEHHGVIYDWYAKTEDEKNKNGIEKGRTTKLVIRKGKTYDSIDEQSFWDEVIANFDRTWITKPTGPAATEIFYSIFDELEKIPAYEDRIYGGSKIRKVIERTKNAFYLN